MCAYRIPEYKTFEIKLNDKQMLSNDLRAKKNTMNMLGNYTCMQLSLLHLFI